VTATRPSAAAYGLRIEGLAPTPWLAVHLASEWPVVVVSRHGQILDDEPRVDLDARRAYVGPTVSESELVHPLLGRIALAFCRTHGTDALHAGVVAGAAGAWALVGSSTSGKSTLLSGCAAGGLEVLSDDVLILRAGRVLTGPRCLDLRQPAGTATAWTSVRGDSRYRVTLPPAAAEHVLTGTVHLSWGDGPELVPLTRAQILMRIFDRQMTEGFPQLTRVANELADLPGYELRRPHDLEALHSSVAILTQLATHG